MLIGIDMIGVQSPESGDRLSGRFARHLARALLAHDPSNRYILYLHEGMATDRVPARRDVPRVSLAPVAAKLGPARRRLATQRIIDRNPEGLDWLILLDPFEHHYGGPPPEAPVSGLKVASVVTNFAPSAVDEKSLRMLGRHDLILAVSEEVARAGRQRLGSSTARVRAIEPATTPRVHSVRDPLTIVHAREFGDLGITGPYLLADVSSGLETDDLFRILDAYIALPVATRDGLQLVLIGSLVQPDPVRQYLHAHGCDHGLVIIGPQPESVIEALIDRCAAYLSPVLDRLAPQALVEAMGRGVAIVAGRSECDENLLGPAGARVDPSETAELVRVIGQLVGDSSTAQAYREKALERAGDFPWESTVESVLSALGEIPRAEMGRFRVDRSHATRPRIAVFPGIPKLGRQHELMTPLRASLRSVADLDFYLDAATAPRVASLPVECGGFDARMFDRNDAIMGYPTVVHEFVDRADILRSLPTLKRRPGLGCLLGKHWLEGTDSEDLRAIESILQTGSRLVVSCPWLGSRLRTALPEFSEQVAVILPPDEVPTTDPESRLQLREQLGFAPEAFVIARVRNQAPDGSGLWVLHAFKDLARTNPDVALLLVGPDDGEEGDEHDIRAVADRLRIGHRVRSASAEVFANFPSLAEIFDLAICQDSVPNGSRYLELLQADVPTLEILASASNPVDVLTSVLPGSAKPELAASLRDLVLSPHARLERVRAARDLFLGPIESGSSAQRWAEEIRRSVTDLPRSGGRRTSATRTPSGSTAPSPHFPRAASSTTMVPADIRSR